MGCRECSRRRIICDERESHCKKCEKKGIECSGYGFRFRFAADNDSRRHQPEPSMGTGAKSPSQITPSPQTQQLRWSTSDSLHARKYRLKRHLTTANFTHGTHKMKRQDRKEVEKQEFSVIGYGTYSQPGFSDPDKPLIRAENLTDLALDTNSERETVTGNATKTQCKAMFCTRPRITLESPSFALQLVPNPQVRMLMHHCQSTS